MEHNEHEVQRMENEGYAVHPDAGEHIDREGQAAEIARLRALTNNPGGGVPLPGAEERAVHAVLTMATVLYGALEDLMWGAECPKNLDRLLDRMEHIIGIIRGTVCAPPEGNVVLLIIDCEDVLLEMQRARGEDTGRKDRLRDWLKAQRLRKMAANMDTNPSNESRSAN